MRTAGTFATILVVGVIIVLIFQWSGDSIAVLIMCIITLFALLALWDRKPWAAGPRSGQWPDRPSGSDIFGRDRSASAAADRDHQSDGGPAITDHGFGSGQRAKQRSKNPTRSQGPTRSGNSTRSGPSDRNSPDDEPTVPPPDPNAVWRSRFDVVIDEDGVTGLELGDAEPATHRWETIASATTGWSQAIAEGDTVEQRLGLHLALRAAPRLEGPSADSEPDHQTPDAEALTQDRLVQLMFGSAQVPERVVEAIGAGMRHWRTVNSRFHHLSPAERTRQLAAALSPTPLTLSKDIHSPELLYQEARRSLLTNHTLRRLGRDADPDHVADAVGQLLSAHQIIDLTGTDGALAAAADKGSVDAVYRAAGRLVEDRGYRLAFIHYGGEDHLLGLLPMTDAPDWDGQTIGSGLAAISLDRPG